MHRQEFGQMDPFLYVSVYASIHIRPYIIKLVRMDARRCERLQDGEACAQPNMHV